MSDFVLPVDDIRMVKVNDVPRERCVRVYKESPEGWCFQLRAPIGLGTNGLRDGKNFIVGSAHLDLEAMRAIRDALTEQIDAFEAALSGAVRIAVTEET